jgi:hypothetical protein
MNWLRRVIYGGQGKIDGGKQINIKNWKRLRKEAIRYRFGLHVLEG